MNSTPSPTISPPEKLNLSTKLAFGAGDLGPAITANISVFFVLVFLTNVAGLPAGLAGSVLMVGKIWDAINDPIVGVLSDRTVHPWGRRYPWMVFGAVPFGILFFLQWIVPSNNQWFLFWYYVIIGILFNTAYTAVNLPYTALTPELTSDYNERTSLNSFRFSFSISGSIFSLILAQIIFSFFPDSPYQKYLILGAVCAILSIFPLFWCFLGTRKRVWAGHSVADNQDNSDSIPIAEQIKIAFSNRPFLLVIGIYLCSWLGVQLTASILPYFVVNWMQMPEATFPQVAIAVQGTALVMLFVWSSISKRYGKKSVYFMGMGVWIIAQAGLFFLQPGQVGLMYILAILAGCGVSTAYLVPWSMIPDVIDLDELNTGQRREGVFYSFMVLLQKIGLAVGLFLVGQALDIAGFLSTVPGQPAPIQPDSALLAVRFAIGPLPTIVLIIGMIFTFLYPITKEVHADILLQLSEKKRQENLH
ncbi:MULTISPECIES: MFS transporter [Planktothrix]|jgi:GPH family glycoside/pentoside/hexuronide:cation symporter|uniref:Sugar (Glycoside-Pentoside-hexuronide) transporter n=2 Tax=Planktothrix TaxID=54304 RepID=A0A4P5ZBB8_PLAAG|nr:MULTISPECIES: MFS transporter [Planktothrix]CAD5976658.1 putative symporter sll1374 [Planktothrix rubescens]CAC5344864.1 Sugar (Glycoside-Pentoside-Hexuronide) transporter [Planktothrix rubescens NIVA-CYA 18]CAD0232084.1 Sugar (Glycoside-Pentoside-Hexuronide) transporter [Planktothrix agardhii]CAD5967953.1 putative symporter sll1374 [Planktothrix rubescens NIVA-CYA 18]CAD5974410.1 putative symporter sll1374 [Planktothrix agardhii]